MKYVQVMHAIKCNKCFRIRYFKRKLLNNLTLFRYKDPTCSHTALFGYKDPTCSYTAYCTCICVTEKTTDPGGGGYGSERPVHLAGGWL
jgi:hypothetical protein